AYIGNDHPRHLPLTVPTSNMIFQSQMSHFGMDNSMQTWAEWSTIRPPSAGFVYLGETYLPIDVSMWHQVHCLSHLRSMIARGDDGSEHTEHCFHYLRQGILCAADPTLEERAEKSFGIDGKEIFPGDGATHTCKNFQYVYEWTVKHRESWTPEMVQRLSEVGSGGLMGHQMSGHAHNGTMPMM
ncbi:hypothetical protein K435DRAFT_660523, partial [Dendrothele bispora CBS 962.96]